MFCESKGEGKKERSALVRRVEISRASESSLERTGTTVSDRVALEEKGAKRRMRKRVRLGEIGREEKRRATSETSLVSFQPRWSR